MSDEVVKGRPHYAGLLGLLPLATPAPMLKDYFNPQLHVVLPVHRRLRQVTVRFEVEEDFVPAL